MGITGLLPFLKKIHVPTNISQFQGATVAVDVYCWLHKGAFSCAEKLAFGEDTDQYIYYCMKYVNFMISKNLKPILVFDGCHLPSKKDVEDSRRERRKVYRQKAAQFLKEGKRSEARECLQRCVDITPDMARKLIEVCQKQGIDCIVAPYEADAQLAYLAQSGIAQIIVTEDSDLLLFGCDKVIFKMDLYGNGIMIEKSRLNEVVDIRDGFYTFSKFRHMCILSGCDYLSSLPGIGLANACKVFKLARQADLRQLLRKIPSYLNKSFSVPNDYIEGFIRAENTFLYQLIFDPLTRKLVPLNPYAEDLRPDDLHYAGEYIPTSEAFNIALGNTDIQTRKKLSSFNPDTDLNSGPEVAAKYNGPHMLSIWNRNYRILSKGLQEKSPLKERPSLKNKEIVTEFKVAQQPRKRLRNVENCLESKSDNELSHIYSLESPSVKKTKLPSKIDENACVIDESVLILRSLLNEQDDESSNDKPTTDEECLETDFTSIKESKISHLDTNPSNESQNPDSMAVLSKENSSQIQEAAKQTDMKQKLNSTHQNKFAIFKEVKRFDINAPKVQSRYFRPEKEEEKKEDNVTTKPSRLSQLFKEETACPKVMEDKSANNNNNGDDDDDDDDKIEDNNNNNNNNNSQNVSPSGVNKEIKLQNKTLSVLSAFSWGKRSTSYGSTNKLTPEPVPQGSDDEVCELSPIPQISDGTKEAASTTDWTSDTRANSTMNSLENGSELFDSGIGCSPPALSRSSSKLEADIIDLDTGSQQSVMGLESASQQSVMGLESASQQSVMGLETGSKQSIMGLETCSQDTVFGFNSLFLSSQVGTPRISTAASKSPKTPKCRVSGLSKKTTKKSSSVAAIKKLDGQQSIKDMFAKFAYTKESKSRMA
ncbi:exonuclease 1 [Octopus bimaculoides]|nr:exonuclease 1 [Octopus bimaculoides]|eukprot:XP_014773722.1 PREDICTED: exonuclease 1-like [Octopus bimaculoides]